MVHQSRPSFGARLVYQSRRYRYACQSRRISVARPCARQSRRNDAPSGCAVAPGSRPGDAVLPSGHVDRMVAPGRAPSDLQAQTPLRLLRVFEWWCLREIGLDESVSYGVLGEGVHVRVYRRAQVWISVLIKSLIFRILEGVW